MLDFEEIKRRRELLQLSQQEAATRAGFTHYQQWANLEKNRKPDPRSSTLRAVAKALKCRMDDLMKDAPAGAPSKRK